MRKTVMVALVLWAIPSSQVVLARNVGATGPAAPALTRYVSKMDVPCYRDHVEKNCKIGEMIDVMALFYGAVDSTNEPDRAAAFIDYQYDNTGSASGTMVIVLNKTGADWTVVGRLDQAPKVTSNSVRFTRSHIAYTSSHHREGDSRAAPSGVRHHRLSYGPAGVKLVPPMTAPH